ncbi:MAG TPA: trehalose-6-phosphate synthase [Mycobacteriales bacterium]|nr:trehalose-6-phosphate synthase [Mycobacteriales bacterium]
MAADLLVASNRGPVSFGYDGGGRLVSRRGGGGLVSGLAAATRGSQALWVCAALSDADREAAARAAASGGLIDGAFDAPLRMLDIPADTYDGAYNGIANSVLWFVNHMLYATPTAPVFDSAFRLQWDQYVDYNAAFAEALAADAAAGAAVLVQDYHLLLTPAMLRALRPDLRIGHFLHTPWAPPDYFGLLPDDVADALVAGLLGADHAGFLARRWADAFAACAVTREGIRLEPDGERPGRLERGDRSTGLGVHPLGVDAPELVARAQQDDVVERLVTLRDGVGDCQVVVRIDRTELSKNIVRGLLAFRAMLSDHPELHGRVVHLVFAYPSRGDLPEYRAYTDEVRATAQQINAEFGTAAWEPIRIYVSDDYPRSLAAMRLADVLVVNPIRDGMNLVAKEGPIVSDDGVALVLSREAGAYAELGSDALVVNPYDVQTTAAAMYAGLTMDPAKRRWRSDRLAHVAGSRPPQQWIADQLAALH